MGISIGLCIGPKWRTRSQQSNTSVYPLSFHTTPLHVVFLSTSPLVDACINTMASFQFLCAIHLHGTYSYIIFAIKLMQSYNNQETLLGAIWSRVFLQAPVKITQCACSLQPVHGSCLHGSCLCSPAWLPQCALIQFAANCCFHVNSVTVEFFNFEKLVEICSCDTILQSFLRFRKVLFNFRGTRPRRCDRIVTLWQDSSSQSAR